MKNFYFRSLFIIFSLLLNQSVFAQLCDSSVPVYPIDFTGHPDTTWTIYNIQRDGLCCLKTNPNRCVEFDIIMDVNQQGIKLNTSGGPALGSGGIQVECDPTEYDFNSPICLSGIGPHHITVCKPGANVYDYYITSIPKPNAGPPIAVSNGCTGIIFASGYEPTSIVWTSVSPGVQGAYNNYLSCTSLCDTSVVTAQVGYPDSIQYQVTGTPLGGCSAMTVTDSVWVYFVTDKTATILPQNPVVCIGVSNAVLTATGTGGLPPYNYQWSTGATTQSITVGVGTYWVLIGDQTNCPKGFTQVTVTSSARPVANFNFTAACTNASTIFTDASTTTAGTVNGWSWDFGDGTFSTLQNPTHIYTASGSYNVSLTASSGAGCDNTIIRTINVTPLPVPSFVSNTPCYIDSVQFTDNSTISSGTITGWSWNFGDGNTGTQQNPSHYYATAGTYNIILTATSSFGCSNTATFPINIQPSPVANFTASVACPNANVSFTNTSTIISGSITGWNWNFGDGNTSIQQNPTHIYNAPGTYSVTLLVNSAAGCSGTIIKTITVNPLPVASFTTNSPCYSDSVRFTNTSSISAGTITGWSWNFGDGNTGTLQNPSHYYPIAGNYNITLIATSSFGCKDTTVLPVNIQPSPVANFTPSTGCANANVSFSDASTILSGTLNGWSWNFGDGNFSTQQNPIHVYAATGTYSVTLIVNSAAGCADTITKSINISPLPIADFVSNSPCYSDSVSFTNNSTISSGSISSWNWDFGDATTSTLQSPNHFYSVAGSYNISLIATSALGCKDTATIAINIQPNPIADFLSSIACTNANVIFTDASTIISGTVSSWNWNFGDGNFSTQQNPIHTYGASGSYTVTLVINSLAGCSATITKTINVSPLPVASFSDNAPACVNTAIIFNDGSTISSGSITNWDWSFGDSNVSTSQNPTYTYGNGGNYNVTLIITTALGCKDTASRTINIQGLPTAIAGNDTSSCSNNASLTISGTILNAGGGIWNANGSFSPPDPTQLSTFYTPSPSAIANGTDTLYLITTNTALCPAHRDTLIITFTPAPTVNGGSNLFVCKDTSSVPVCASVTVASGVWWHTTGSGTFVDDSLLCTQYIPSTADTTAGSVLLYISSTGNGTCIATNDSVIVTFTATPIVTITSNDSSCAGNPFNIAVTSTTGSGFWTSNGTGSFNPNNTVLNGLYNPSTSDDAAGNVTLYFNSTNNGGCRITTDSLNVKLIPSPTANYFNTSVCETFPTMFTDSSTSVGSVVNWNWNFGDATPSTSLQNPSHLYNTNGTFNVQLIVTSNNGCLDTLTKIVTVHDKPNAGYDANGNCIGDGTQFTDTSSVLASTITSWSWNFGDASILNTTQNPLHVYPSSGTYNPILIVQSAQGCLDTIVHTINLLPSPTANFGIDDVTANVGQTVNFTDLSTNGPINWFWDFGDSQTDSTSTSQNPSHIYYTGGYYNVCLFITDNNGCTDTICKPEIVSLPPVIPTGYTPNGDGENDILYVYGGPFKTMEFTIYNNWGEIIFTSNKQSEGWDGKRKGIDQPIGVYVYILKAVTEDGESYKLSGDVTLLR